MARKKKPASDENTDFDEKAEAEKDTIASEISDTDTPDETPDTEEVSAPEDKADAEVEAGDDKPAAAAEADETEAISTHADEQSDSQDTLPITAPEPVVIRKGGFVPMVLGGLVAGAIGFGLAQYVMPEPGPDMGVLTDLQRTQKDQADADSMLAERVELLESGPDLSGIEAGQSDNQAAISGLADRLSSLEERLTDIEKRPAGEGVSGAAVAAYERELQELKTAVEAMTENAALLEENAQAAAKATLQRAALTRILTALDAGVGFESALADLKGLGIDVPDVLQQASGGISSLTDLQESFPDAARAALSASRDATGETGNGGFSSFLRTQLGARSLEPREGEDPDAVLSRAEAAARDGRLTDALAEIEALPEEGRAELANWSSRASQRLEVVAAAQGLGDQLN